MTHQSTHSSARTVAQGLGWFSIGVGLAELFMSRKLAWKAGMEGQETLLQAYGLREIANGIGILAAKDAAPWIWARVGGDALDLATLGARLEEQPARLDSTGMAMAAVLGVTAVDVACARALSQDRSRRSTSLEYSRRSGFPRPPAEMRGAALRDFQAPPDMRPPAAMQPYGAEKAENRAGSP